jgi:hypothetical protein
MEAALRWLERRKPDMSDKSYREYRYALFHFEKYFLNGSIRRTRCCNFDQFSCRDTALKLPATIYELYSKLESVLYNELTEANAKYYSQGCKDFLQFVAEQGCRIPADISIEHVIDYKSRFRGTASRMQYKEASRLSGVAKLLAYLAECGDIPRCYTSVLRSDAVVTLLPSLKLDTAGTALHPSKKLDPLAEEFLSCLDEQRYSASVKKKYRHDIINYFLFIEANHIEHSRESVASWLGRSQQNGIWERKRHTLTLFADYITTRSIESASYLP